MNDQQTAADSIKRRCYHRGLSGLNGYQLPDITVIAIEGIRLPKRKSDGGTFATSLENIV